MPDTAPTPADADSPPLGVWDAGSLIIGIVIGVSLFRVPGDVLSHVPGPLAGLSMWLLGGLLSLFGALCYCELATAYPQSGGDYVYLTRAYGRCTGFLFGWMRFTIIHPANIGAMAFVFAEHAVRLFRLPPGREALLAMSAIGLLTILNLFGVTIGKQTQNTLTVSKIAGLAAIVAAGAWLAWSGAGGEAVSTTTEGSANAMPSVNYGLALIFVLYSYGGWNDAAFVAAEVRDVRRNIPRALLLGLGTITAVYLLVNVAYIGGLGVHGVRSANTPAADLLQAAWGDSGDAAISVIVMLSALGAANGMIFAGSRVFSAMGAEHRAFAILGRWDTARRSPVRALSAIGLMSLLLVWLVGTDVGTRLIRGILASLRLEGAVLSSGAGGFETLVVGTAPIFWVFLLLSGLSVIVLRRREPEIDRPFRCGAPLVPLIFCATSAYMLWSGTVYAFNFARSLAVLSLVVLLGGFVLFLATQRRPRAL
ncbi:MAG: amino acid permease [Planctomycetota bacterium]|nr:MAG: amino acid permease [Planctomycetota bacterium]REJ95322.1 MAG: amino acid permease [Planctomycetota bacterium]REK24237.1 MAG: amino acid permease [Planctomycetota bacterium]REK28778.1 MAG: amino acid permease [Planctomycetota bacterium]